MPVSQYDADAAYIKSLQDQVGALRAALTAIVAEGAGPGKRHISTVYMARMAREALTPQEAHP